MNENETKLGDETLATQPARNIGADPYNPEYGDDRACVCGHPYYRHFDGYENNANVGCKYCYFSSEEERAQVAAVPGSETWADAGVCPGFTPADGIDTPDPAFEAFKQLMQSLAEQAKQLMQATPGLAEAVARDWQHSSAQRMPWQAVLEAAHSMTDVRYYDGYDDLDDEDELPA